MQDIQCLTILSADRTWREDNGKLGMVGIFDQFHLPSYPAQVLPFGLYVRLGNVPAGHHELVTNVINEKNHAVVASVTVNLDTPEFQQVFQLHYPVPPLHLVNPGDYAIHISVDGVQVAKHIIKANLIRSE